jgi:hypothetical protein
MVMENWIKIFLATLKNHLAFPIILSQSFRVRVSQIANLHLIMRIVQFL